MSGCRVAPRAKRSLLSPTTASSTRWSKLRMLSLPTTRAPRTAARPRSMATAAAADAADVAAAADVVAKGRAWQRAPRAAGVAAGEDDDEDFEDELPPTQPPVHAFGSVWDSQIGVPPARRRHRPARSVRTPRTTRIWTSPKCPNTCLPSVGSVAASAEVPVARASAPHAVGRHIRLRSTESAMAAERAAAGFGNSSAGNAVRLRVEQSARSQS